MQPLRRACCCMKPGVNAPPPETPRHDSRRLPVSLFDTSPVGSNADLKNDPGRPLAERMRPETLDEFAGQQHVIGPGKPLRGQIERDQLQSIILWGPPGSG